MKKALFCVSMLILACGVFSGCRMNPELTDRENTENEKPSWFGGEESARSSYGSYSQGMLFSKMSTKDHLGNAVAFGDFNNDGYDDLVISEEGDNNGAGAVHIVYGAKYFGLNVQVFNQDTPGIQGGCEAGDLFGASLAVGDYNGDKYDDLAIGAPGESIGTTQNSGMVHILYGSAAGLSATGNQVWHQNCAGLSGVTAEVDDYFGNALTAGDFNGDGKDDLAVGVYGESIGSLKQAGCVEIFYGSTSGLKTSGHQLWDQDVPGMYDWCEGYDRFGDALAAADFNNDGYEDLAIGVPGESLGSKAQAGLVHILFGTSSGLNATGDLYFYLTTYVFGQNYEIDDCFGGVLTSGDFNNDKYADLAIGVSGRSVDSKDNAGMVSVVYGGSTGHIPSKIQNYHQNTYGIAGSSEANDFFGCALGSGDFNADGYDDLIVGASGESRNSVAAAGYVHVIFGASGGLTNVGDKGWFQEDMYYNPMSCLAYDKFGTSVAAGDIDGNGHADLAIGAIGKDFGNISDAGYVQLVSGEFNADVIFYGY